MKRRDVDGRFALQLDVRANRRSSRISHLAARVAGSTVGDRLGNVCESGDDVLVACAQEAPLFEELADEADATGAVTCFDIARSVNLLAGRDDGAQCGLR